VVIVKLNDIDISKYVMSVSSIEQNAGDYGQITSVDFPDLTGENTTGFWDTTNQASPFFGNVELSKNRIEIINDGVSIFNGVLLAINSDDQSRTAAVTIKSDIQRKLEKDIIFASDDVSTPSAMVENICNLYGIETNPTSFSRSQSVYTQNNIVTSAFFQGETTILNAIQQIAEIGVARAYIYNQKLNFDVFRERNAPSSFLVTDVPRSTNSITLKSNVETENQQKEPKQGYRIEYVGGEGPLAATLGSEEQQEFAISAGSSNSVRINNLVSAIWLGDKWIEYFNKAQQVYTFEVPVEYGKVLQINDPISIEFRGRSEILIDIIGINNTKKVTSTIKGLSR
jgi:hypothetical protein